MLRAGFSAGQIGHWLDYSLRHRISRNVSIIVFQFGIDLLDRHRQSLRSLGRGFEPLDHGHAISKGGVLW
jgi:hypothetical protein